MAKDTKGQVEEILSELGKKIDVLINETKNAGGEVRDDIEDRIRELKKRKSKLESDFRAYKDKNDDKWQEIKQHLVTAVHELKLAVETAFTDSQKKKKK
ncbi:MAG: hypothetical protein KI791_23155 [Cyclobacteriaceae bacterium]|nr:hypothetical protein [Cyclobacteriaceae bacterium SS2]